MSTNTGDKHKFQADSGMTFEEVYEFAFKTNFIPTLKWLGDELQFDDFIETLKRARSKVALQQGQGAAESLPINDFAAYKGFVLTLWSDRLWKHALTLDVTEETDEALEIKVTECLWAKTFRANGAADIGYAAICHPDFAHAQGFNPKISMTRTKCLMQGDVCCNHRWAWEE
jgi:hypothetical protein